MHSAARTIAIACRKSLPLLLAGLLLAACSKPSGKEEKETGKPIAAINDSKLYADDIKSMIPQDLSAKDSLGISKRLVEKWATDELFYQQALNELDEEEQNIDKELLQYKKDLISYRFQIKLINQQLDTNVSAQEIEEYYNNNPQNFLLKNNIVKAIYVKAPRNMPNLEKLRKLCLSTNPKDSTAFKSMCIQFADNYFIDNNTWLLLDDIKKEMPQLRDVPEYNLTANKTFEFNDSLSYYFLKLREIKIKNSLSPLNFERGNIKNLVINQRKQFLIRKYKKDLLEKAKADKTIVNY